MGRAGRPGRFAAALTHFRRPFHEHYGQWFHGGWANWSSYPAFWSSLASDSWLGPVGGADVFTYSNPYFTTPTSPVAVGLDYSEPLAVPTDEQAADMEEALVQQAMDAFDRARAEFRRGHYGEATGAVDRALALLPGDRTMQEFRAECLFARKRYAEAAAVLYAVLAQGPGWDYDTLMSLYPDAETYTQQLRALEDYVSQQPEDGPAHFVLAYQYLVLDDHDAAVEQLRAAAELTPGDKLSAQLANALSRP